MRLLLVDNLLYEDYGGRPRYDLQPHLGLISLVAVARRGGHDAEIYDPKWDLARQRLRLNSSLYPAMAERIAAYSSDVVGFTALGCNFHCVAKVASRLKHLKPGLPVLLGGPHASILHRQILDRFDMFDAIARHEAEPTLLPLLERLGTPGLDDVPSISYRSSHGEVRCNPAGPTIEDLDQLPFPAYDCYPIEESGLDWINIEAGRGCPFSCTFCSTATFFGRNFRLKSSEYLVAMMDRLNMTYGFTRFSLQHDLFTVNRKKIFAFCDAVRDRNYGWSCSARVDCVDDQLLRAMAAAGCRGIFFGIETGSPRMQAISRKRLDVELVEPTLDLACELGMTATASFITGYPEEEAADQATTLDFAGRLHMPPHTNVSVQLHLLTPEPGTALMEQYGNVLQFDGHVSDFNFPMLEPDDTALLEKNPDLFGNHHFFPTVLPRERHVFVTLAWRALGSLSGDVVRYLLTAFEGRLSRFLDSVDAWRGSLKTVSSPIDPSFLTAFLAARFGKHHHLVSLCRYGWATLDRPSDTTDEPGALPIQHSHARLMLSRRIELLADIHRPKTLAAILSRRPDTIVSDRSARPLVCLLVKAEGPAGKTVTFEIDRVMLAFLERYRQPKTYAQLRCEMLAAGNSDIPCWSDICELCDDGVLICAPSAPTALAAE